MVRKRVSSLYQSTVALVNEQISKFAKQHSDSKCVLCTLDRRPEECPVAKTAKEYFALPGNITQDVFDLVPSVRNCNEPMSVMRYLFCFLVHHSGLDMGTFVYSKKDDILFSKKYSENIKELCFVYGKHERNFKTTLQPVLHSMKNIKVLDFVYSLPLSDDHFQIIGSECAQLETLKGFHVCSSVTEKSFQKLCYSTRNRKQMKHNCCSTLRNIEIEYYGRGANLIKRTEIVSYLLQNIPNLNSFVEHFYADLYLQSASGNAVLNTTLENIGVSHLTNDLIPALKSFCPNMKQLKFASTEQGALVQLNISFPNLEKLELERCSSSSDRYLVRDILTAKWLNVRSLYLCICYDPILYLSVLANQLPILEELRICDCTEINWDGITCFKSLLKVNLEFLKLPSNLLAVASFAQTVKSLNIKTSRGDMFNVDMLKSVFANVPFPVLSKLDIANWTYTVNIITDIIEQCPLLENFALFYKHERSNSAVSLMMREITVFLNNNNLSCDLLKQWN